MAREDVAALVLRLVNVAAALCTVFGSILIPRRPEVFFRGQTVDAQWTSSILSRYTWTWPRPIMDLASKQGDLDEKDIPQPDHTIRASEVLRDWHAYGYKGKLQWAILYAYKGRLALQWAVTVARCILGVGPFWTMLQLLTLLQERGGGGSPSRTLWGLVILLGVFSLVEQVSKLIPMKWDFGLMHGFGHLIVDGWLGQLLLHCHDFAAHEGPAVRAHL